jgi:hypothetical protein
LFDSNRPLYLLPGVDFCKLFYCPDITDKTRSVMWKYLQVILFNIVGTVQDRSKFGPAAESAFADINEEELLKKLTDAIQSMGDFFQEGVGGTEQEAGHGQEQGQGQGQGQEQGQEQEQEQEQEPTGSSDTKQGPGSGPSPNMPNPDELYGHLRGLFAGKIGTLAKEMAEEIAGDLSGLLGEDFKNMKSTKDVLEKLMKNPQKMAGLIQTVRDKLTAKLKSGEISQEEMLKEAQQIFGSMGNMGNIGKDPNMKDMMKLFSKLTGKDFAQMMKSFGDLGNMGKSGDQDQDQDQDMFPPRPQTVYQGVAELGGKLSHLKYVSPHIVFSNKQCILGFLDAYISGDGCVCQYKNSSGEMCPSSISVASTSHTMLTDVSVMLRNLGVATSLHKTHTHQTNNRGTLPENIHQTYALDITNHQAQILASMLHLTIAHKQEKLQQIIDKKVKYEFSRIHDHVFPNVVNGELIMQTREGRMVDLQFDPVVSIEEVPNTTPHAYDLTVEDTRTFDCYHGLGVLDTFHSAGIGSKSNVTRGVPRIEEILRLTKNPKASVMSVFMHGADEEEKDKASTFATELQHTKLIDVVKTVQSCFDPNELSSNIIEDRMILEQFYEFEKIMQECVEPPTGGPDNQPQ